MSANLEINNLKSELKLLTLAYSFSAHKHSKQRRKGAGNIPFINHPIEVANLLAQTVGTGDLTLIVCAVLHDTLEDTETTEEEIKDLFGEGVLGIVKEVTDDMSLSSQDRKIAQIRSASSLSESARLIKIADKQCNILDMLKTRFRWTKKQKIEYILWACEVVDVCRGVNKPLDAEFDKAILLSKQYVGGF